MREETAPAAVEKAVETAAALMVIDVPLLTAGNEVRDGYLGWRDFQEIREKKGCEYAEVGIWADGSRVGQRARICRRQECRQHWRKETETAAKKGGVTARRKQELFDLRVADRTRLRVFGEGQQAFNEAAWPYADGELLNLLLARLYSLTPDKDREVIQRLAGREGKKMFDYDGTTGDKRLLSRAKRIGKLTEAERSRLLFLLIAAPLGENHYAQSWECDKAY